MNNQQKIEELLANIINLFADEFGNQAILRGGMVLRLLDSPRLTSDLDYMFIPYKSKKDILEPVNKALNKIPNITTEFSFNSKCLKCIIKKEEITVQVEIKVDKACKVNIISTSSLSKNYNLNSRIISVMAYDIALANKLAAWYERRLMRDLYDIYLFANMGIKPEKEILQRRLEKPNSEDKKRNNPITINDFYLLLKQETEKINEKILTNELKSILPINELLGLDFKIKNVILNKLL